MSARTFRKATASRAALDLAVATSEPHLRPIVKAVRDHGVDMLFASQDAGAFRIPAGRSNPVIFLIGDDFDRALGPDGFHLPSIRRAIRACSAFAVVSSAPQADAYKAIARMAALTRRNVMLIETRLEQELAWMGLIQKLAPKRFIWLATVEGGHA